MLLSLNPAIGISEYRNASWPLLIWAAGTAALIVGRSGDASIAIVIATSVGLRLAAVGINVADPIIVAQAAGELALDGGNPYGIPYQQSAPPGAPYPYGPLGLVWWLPGPFVELVAAITTMGVLWAKRALVTLGLFAGWGPSVYLNLSGINDYSPALLILTALFLMRSKPLLGALLLGVASALKPYAFAWVLPAVVYLGWPAAAMLLVSVAVTWSPALLYGIDRVWFSLTLAQSLPHHLPDHPRNVLRWLAVPAALLGLLVRRWEMMVLAGCAVYALFLFLPAWLNLGYVIAFIPLIGVVSEELVRSRWPVRRVAHST